MFPRWGGSGVANTFRTMLSNLTNTHTIYIPCLTFSETPSKNYYPHCTKGSRNSEREGSNPIQIYTGRKFCKLFAPKGSLNKMRDKQDPYKFFPPTPFPLLVAGSEEDFKNRIDRVALSICITQCKTSGNLLYHAGSSNPFL